MKEHTEVMSYGKAQINNAIEVIFYILLGIQIFNYFLKDGTIIIAIELGRYIAVYIWIKAMISTINFPHRNCWWSPDKEAEEIYEMYRASE